VSAGHQAVTWHTTDAENSCRTCRSWRRRPSWRGKRLER